MVKQKTFSVLLQLRSSSAGQVLIYSEQNSKSYDFKSVQDDKVLQVVKIRRTLL